LIFKEPHGVISQKTELFIITAVRTSNSADIFVVPLIPLTSGDIMKLKVTDRENYKGTITHFKDRQFPRAVTG
jgi:hypothetical protein